MGRPGRLAEVAYRVLNFTADEVFDFTGSELLMDEGQAAVSVG